MKKRGFTLVELLAVIVILAIILAIAVPAISNLIENSRVVAYQNSEKMLASAARNYLAGRNELIPSKVNNIYVISSGELITNGFLSNLKDVTDSSSTCDGYVIVKRISDANHELQPYMKCGSNYRTTDYADANLATVEVLVVAGGGGGGTSVSSSGGGGGGGAGGLIYNSTYTLSGTGDLNVVVGNGGNPGGTNLNQYGSNGENSMFDTITAIGGGGGAKTGVNGLNGGSGGGGGYNGYSTVRYGGIATSGQGNNGGNTSQLSKAGGAGGGGAGGVGEDNPSTSHSGGNGGLGLYYSISGSSVYYANGGRGGNGGAVAVISPANTGKGGDGAYAQAAAYAGGSGIVIVRYPGHQKANGGTVTYVNGYAIHTFTNVGNDTLTVLTFE